MTHPDKMAMLYVDRDKNERRFTFKELSEISSQTANYFQKLGIKKGDRVMMVLKRHYQFWFAILALHKLGAIVIPSTHQLKEEDFAFRFDVGDISAIFCTHQDDVVVEADKALNRKDYGIVKIMTGTPVEGWNGFDAEMPKESTDFEKVQAGGDDIMLMFFTSGTTGYPKMVTHNFKYPLGHFVTAKYWQHVNPDGLHFTLSDTGWGKALWGNSTVSGSARLLSSCMIWTTSCPMTFCLSSAPITFPHSCTSNGLQGLCR